MKRIRLAVVTIALGAASGFAAAASADSAHASFADLYRVSALRPVSTEPQSQTQPVRYAFSVATPTTQAGGYAFSIGAMPEPGRWLLFLSGVAVAGWVARRRLYSY
jgi:hypothetical protein